VNLVQQNCRSSPHQQNGSDGLDADEPCEAAASDRNSPLRFRESVINGLASRTLIPSFCSLFGAGYGVVVVRARQTR
jgi:hypothetical protein